MSSVSEQVNGVAALTGSTGQELSELLRMQSDPAAIEQLLLRIGRGFDQLSTTLEVVRKQAHDSEKANQAKSQFLAAMSHEIRTPLGAIIGLTDLAREENDAAKRDDLLATVGRSARHLLTILDDILDLSKIEAGKMEMEKINVSPREILSDIMSLMSVRAAAKHVQLKLDLESPLPPMIESDPTRLRQILLNLVGNAIKFTQAGTVTLKASFHYVTPARDVGDLVVKVIDTGTGMSEETLGKLFSPFTQADESVSRRHGGTGLGLAISLRLAKLLGGWINASSALGEGSTFQLSIRAAVRRAERSEVSQTRLPPKASASLVGLNVLVVDDMPENRLILERMLVKFGAGVTLAANGIGAIEQATRPGAGFDVILMDMVMPEMDGYQATSTLRLKGLATPIVAVTASAMDSDRRRCFEVGCTGFLPKPIDPGVLVQVLQPMVRRAA
jgi:signal transduction histidine kinase